MPADRIGVRAEELASYRWANLLLIAEVHSGTPRHRPLSLDRIAIYEFFSAHPFLLFEADTKIGRKLIRAGLEPRSLTYASAPDRLANRRQRVRADISDLVSRQLVDMEVCDGRLAIRITDSGMAAAEELRTFQAGAIRESAMHVLAKLDKVADRTLHTRSREWTRQNAMLIDVLEMA